MKCGSNSAFRLVLVFFLLDFAAQMTSVGSLVSSSLEKNGLQSTAAVVILTTAACIISLLINYFFKPLAPLYKYMPLGIFISAVLSAVLAAHHARTDVWLLLLFAKLILGFILPSWGMASLKEFTGTEVVQWNRAIQILTSIGSIGSLAAGPYIALSRNLSIVFILDCIFLLSAAAFSVGLIPSQANVAVRNHSNLGNTPHAKKSSAPVFALCLAVFFTYISGGIFNVLEVPFLNRYLAATQAQISIVFVLTGIGHVVGSLMTTRLAIKHRSRLLAFVPLSLIAIGFLYLQASQLLMAYIFVFMFGIVNVIFLLLLSSHYHELESLQARAHAFMLSRLSANSGILIAAIAILLVNDIDKAIRYYWVGALISIFGIFLSSRLLTVVNILTVFLISPCFELMSPVLASEPDATKSGLTIRVPISALPSSFVPYQALDANSVLVLRQIYDTLYSYGPDDSLEGDLAESHLLSDQGKRIIVKLRKGIRFADGSEMTALDVQNSIKTATLAAGREEEWALGYLEGYNKFIRSHDPSSPLLGIKVRSRYEIEFRLSRPFGQFLQVLSAPHLAIFKNIRGTLIGTGAYILDPSSSKSNGVVLVKNENSKLGPNSPRRIEFILAKDDEEAVKLATSGKIDVYAPKNQKKTKPFGFNALPLNYLHETILLMNSHKSIFADPKQRCKLGSAMEHVMALDSTYKLRAVSTTLPFGNNVEDENTQQTGIIRSERPIGPVEILITNSEAEFNDDSDSAIVQIMLSYNIKISFKQLAFGDFFKRIRSGDFTAAIIGYVPDYLDATALFTPLLGSNQLFNFVRYSNLRVDKLLEVANQQPDPNIRANAFRKIMWEIKKDCPLYFLGSQNATLYVSKHVVLPKLNSMGFPVLRFKTVEINKN